jgi:hypothetical protein
MANEKIQIQIGATDEASPKIEKIAKKIDGLEADEARIIVTADTAKLEKQLDRAKAKLDGLEGDEASVQARLVGTLEADLAQAQDLLAKLDGQTATVKIDSVGAKQGIDDLGKSADSSKSVLANMIGNTTQDLGTLGGVAGSAGVAIGQMGEYMADAAASGEGLSSITKNFVAVAGPIAALTAATFLVTETVKAFGQPAKEAAERTKEVGEAMKNTTSATLAFVDVLRSNADELENFTLDRKDGLGKFNDALTDALDFLPGVGKASIDVLEVAKRMDISMFDLAKQLAGTGQTTEDFTAQLDAAVRAGKITRDEADFLAQSVANYGDAAAQAAKDQGLFNVSVEEANLIFQGMQDPLTKFAGGFKVIKDDMADGAITTEAAAGWINMLADALGITTEAVIRLAAQDMKGEIAKPIPLAESLARKMEALRTKTDGFTQAFQNMSDELDNSNTMLDLAQGFDDVASKAFESAVAIQDGSIDAQAKLYEQATAQNALKQEVIDYAEEVGEIPPAAVTQVNALIDQGSFDEAERLLAEITKKRTVTIELIGKRGGDLLDDRLFGVRR